jgi:hypothetical protein
VPGGEPVEGATIEIDGTGMRTTSAADGTFAFEEVGRGKHVLHAQHHNWVSGRQEIHHSSPDEHVVIRLKIGVALHVTVVDADGHPAPNAQLRSWAGDLAVATTDETGEATLQPLAAGWLDIEVRAPGHAVTVVHTAVGSPGAVGHVVVVVRVGYPVSGRVIDEHGTGLAGVRVHTHKHADVSVSDTGFVTTDALGNFTTSSLPIGIYQLSAVDGIHTLINKPTIYIDRSIVGVEISMVQGGIISGIVLGQQQMPAPYATVRAVLSHNSSAHLIETTCDESGRFMIRGLNRSEYHLYAVRDNAASNPAIADLAHATETVEMQLVLEDSPRISGIVVDDSVAPVADVSVTARLLGNIPFASSTMTGIDGRFSIPGLPQAMYALWAGDESNFDVHAAPGDDVRIVLSRPGGIKGSVIVEDTPILPRRFIVQAIGQDGGTVPTPAEHGQFRLHSLRAGLFKLRVRGPDFTVTESPEVRVAPGRTSDVGVIVVSRGRMLSGRVVDDSGRPAIGVRVVAGHGDIYRDDIDENVSGIRSATSDSSGAFTIVGLPLAGFNVGADDPSSRSRSHLVRVPADKAQPTVTLEIRAYGSMTGRVMRGGKPIAGLVIRVGEPELLTTETDENGMFIAGPVPEGEVVVSVLPIGGQIGHSEIVRVVAGADVRTTIALPIEQAR